MSEQPQWVAVAEAINQAQGFGTEVGWTTVERSCQTCGAPWVETYDKDGAVAYCRDHPNDPAHMVLVERVTGPPSKPLDIAEWAVDQSPTRPQSEAAATATRWLRSWIQNGLENLPRLRADLAADIDSGSGRSPSRSLYAVVSNPIGGDSSQLSVDHLDSALRFLLERISNLGGNTDV